MRPSIPRAPRCPRPALGSQGIFGAGSRGIFGACPPPHFLLPGHWGESPAELMAAAPQIRGAPPKQGVPSPLLILSLLLLLPGCTARTPPPSSVPPPSSEPPTPLSVPTSPGSGPSCGSWGGVRVLPGPPSRSAPLGSPLAIECRFEPAHAEVTWLQVCPRRYLGDTWGCSWPQEVAAEGGGRQVSRNESGVSRLSFPQLRRDHGGLYFCRVRLGQAAAQSCGTFVRVLEPVPVPLLDVGDAAKNRILAAQGALLLLCAAGPGLLLLFRRWANERLLQPKKISLEEENLYEGLNLDECSMYEDISRGLQPTYQDVGTPPAAEGLLEKP
ncbi:B-cell antigen receptor complex-associated protein alpha chain isoform X2 [Pyrgilauda ruficollis]|uniref:B-cell antigen receptor complex-associated protein alpha chain isoform X2 n=1 Tax=Pyrgilauda ruficollis TaxID=221976 RepID=UPI001B85C4FD|nr:B-cell antigen receptor complex-associated protein alpha chain isoform X2 [Pyrgilauda ruficollis]